MQAHDFELAPPPGHRSAAPREHGAGQAPAVQAILDLQRLAGNESVSTLLDEDQRSPVHDVVGSGGGSPLEPATRRFMEDRLGQDFSDVRVHTGPAADESARSIGAQAYTVGTDVVFRSGGYAPETDAGRHVLAHELTHVVQQKAGPVAGTPAPGGIRLSDPADPFEQAAERTADRVTSEPAPVRRQGEGTEEEEVQSLVAQRLGDGEEEEPELGD